MPRFLPFRGLRYDLAHVDAAAVTAPPYDVIDAAERARLASRHPANVVVIDLPEGEGDRYAAAARHLVQWQEERILVRDAQPTFTVYRMSYADPAGHPRHTTGVFGALELSRPGEGSILPHEHTTPKAKSDRLRLTQATGANLSAVWGLSPAEGLSALLDPADEPPLAEWRDDEGVSHAVWLLHDPDRMAAIVELVSSQPVVIADGHHRYETALAYRDERRATGTDAGGAEGTLVFLVELVDEELTVLPIHRLLSDLPDGFDLVEALEPFFEVGPVAPIDGGIADRMQEAGALALVLTGGARLLTPRPVLLAQARDLDTSRLDVALASLPAHTLEFQHGVDHVQARVASGEAQAGVLLRPAPVAQIIEIAHGGERMPPKTTFFHPKPRTGVVFRLLDEPLA